MGPSAVASSYLQMCYNYKFKEIIQCLSMTFKQLIYIRQSNQKSFHQFVHKPNNISYRCSIPPGYLHSFSLISYSVFVTKINQHILQKKKKKKKTHFGKKKKKKKKKK